MPNSQSPDPTKSLDALRAEYGEVCSNFRMLTDIRFKLLAFLPLAAGVTTAFTGSSTVERFLISLFGLAVTIGLATYNSRNDQLYDELVGRAAEIERRLGVPDGAFANRPGPWLKLDFGGVLRHRIDHRTGVAIIYAASFSLWLFGIVAPILDFLRRQLSASTREALSGSHVVPIAALGLAVTVVFVAAGMIRSQRKRRRLEMVLAAERAVCGAQARSLDELAEDEAFVRDCRTLSGAKGHVIQARARFFAQLPEDSYRFYVPSGSKQQEASYLVASITDLPPRWIYDWITNRRGDLPG